MDRIACLPSIQTNSTLSPDPAMPPCLTNCPSWNSTVVCSLSDAWLAASTMIAFTSFSESPPTPSSLISPEDLQNLHIWDRMAVEVMVTCRERSVRWSQSKPA